MLRWLFLFLLLTNVLLLLWFSSFKKAEERAGVPVAETDLRQIKLLTELDPATLQVKQQDAEPSELQCWRLSAFSELAVAQWVEKLAVERGLAAEVISEPADFVGYAVRVELESAGDRARLATYMQMSRALDITADDLRLDDSYIVGLYRKQAEAENELQKLLGAGLHAFMIYEERPGQRYLVSVFAAAEQNLFKEIKEIVLRRYSDIKIVKKVCEGVARP